jgi:hypothetical protein
MATRTAPDLFSNNRDEWIKKAQDAARKFLELHDEVTIDDVLRLCPCPRYFHRNTIGRVLSKKHFKLLYHKASVNRTRHGSIIGVWGMLDEMPVKPKRVKEYGDVV